jgi:hypothetical protein
MILRATIGRRCVCRVIFFFFSFLTYSPFCSPNISFYPFTPFNGTGTTKFGTKSFLYFFGFHLKALSYELLVIQSLDLHINYGFEWHLFDRAQWLSPALISSLSFLHPSLPLCCISISQLCFSCFCVFAFLYRCTNCVQVPCGLVDVDVSLPMRRVDLFLFNPVL